MKKNYFNYCNFEKVFFCTESDEVKEGYVIAQDITITDEGESLVGLTIETEDKERHNISAKLCYATIDEYRGNFPIKLDERHFISIKGISCYDDKPVYYTIENGQVVRNYAELKHIRVTSNDDEWVFTSPDIPTDKPIYSNAEVAEQMCRTEWTDDEGKKHVKDGVLSLILLNDEQKAALQAFRAALQRCKELKVAIGFDTDSCQLYAWSKASVKDAYFSYESDEGEEAMMCEKDVIDNFLTGMRLEYIGCDDTMYVFRKDEPQQAD